MAEEDLSLEVAIRPKLLDINFSVSTASRSEKHMLMLKQPTSREEIEGYSPDNGDTCPSSNLVTTPHDRQKMDMESHAHQLLEQPDMFSAKGHSMVPHDKYEVSLPRPLGEADESIVGKSVNETKGNHLERRAGEQSNLPEIPSSETRARWALLRALASGRSSSQADEHGQSEVDHVRMSSGNQYRSDVERPSPPRTPKGTTGIRPLLLPQMVLDGQADPRVHTTFPMPSSQSTGTPETRGDRHSSTLSSSNIPSSKEPRNVQPLLPSPQFTDSRNPRYVTQFENPNHAGSPARGPSAPPQSARPSLQGQPSNLDQSPKQFHKSLLQHIEQPLAQVPKFSSPNTLPRGTLPTYQANQSPNSRSEERPMPSNASLPIPQQSHGKPPKLVTPLADSSLLPQNSTSSLRQSSSQPQTRPINPLRSNVAGKVTTPVSQTQAPPTTQHLPQVATDALSQPQRLPMPTALPGSTTHAPQPQRPPASLPHTSGPPHTQAPPFLTSQSQKAATSAPQPQARHTSPAFSQSPSTPYTQPQLPPLLASRPQAPVAQQNRHSVPPQASPFRGGLQTSVTSQPRPPSIAQLQERPPLNGNQPSNAVPRPSLAPNSLQSLPRTPITPYQQQNHQPQPSSTSRPGFDKAKIQPPGPPQRVSKQQGLPTHPHSQNIMQPGNETQIMAAHSEPPRHQKPPQTLDHNLPSNPKSSTQQQKPSVLSSLQSKAAPPVTPPRFPQGAALLHPGMSSGLQTAVHAGPSHSPQEPLRTSLNSSTSHSLPSGPAPNHFLAQQRPFESSSTSAIQPPTRTSGSLPPSSLYPSEKGHALSGDSKLTQHQPIDVPRIPSPPQKPSVPQSLSTPQDLSTTQAFATPLNQLTLQKPLTQQTNSPPQHISKTQISAIPQKPSTLKNHPTSSITSSPPTIFNHQASLPNRQPLEVSNNTLQRLKSPQPSAKLHKPYTSNESRPASSIPSVGPQRTAIGPRTPTAQVSKSSDLACVALPTSTTSPDLKTTIQLEPEPETEPEPDVEAEAESPPHPTREQLLTMLVSGEIPENLCSPEYTSDLVDCKNATQTLSPRAKYLNSYISEVEALTFFPCYSDSVGGDFWRGTLLSNENLRCRLGYSCKATCKAATAVVVCKEGREERKRQPPGVRNLWPWQKKRY